jgi:hypothetical protein
VQDYQDLKVVEDKTSDMVLCLDSTHDTVTTLAQMYRQYRSTPSPGSAHLISNLQPTLGSDEVPFALDEKLKDVAYSRKKAESILTKAQNTRALASSYSISEGVKLIELARFPRCLND